MSAPTAPAVQWRTYEGPCTLITVYVGEVSVAAARYLGDDLPDDVHARVFGRGNRWHVVSTLSDIDGKFNGYAPVLAKDEAHARQWLTLLVSLYLVTPAPDAWNVTLPAVAAEEVST